MKSASIMNRSHWLWSMINHHCASVIIKLGIPKFFFKTKHKWNCIQFLLDVRIFAYVDCLFHVNTIFLLCCVTLCYRIIFCSICKSAPFSICFFPPTQISSSKLYSFRRNKELCDSFLITYISCFYDKPNTISHNLHRHFPN